MKTTKTIALTACLLIGTFNLIAQGQQNSSKYTPLFYKWVKNHKSATGINLGKKGAKVMLDSLNYTQWDTVANAYNPGGTKFKFYYDANGNNHTEILSVFIDQINMNLDFGKYTNTFNTNNKLVKQEVVLNNGLDVWENNNKTEYTYDSKGNKITSKHYNWIKTSDSWQITASFNYTYNANNKVDIEIDSNFNTTLFSILKTVSTYDANGNITNDTRYTWKNNSWAIDYKNDYNYDTKNNLSFEINSTFDASNSTYTNSTKVKYTYDGDGNMGSSVNYTWNAPNGQWDFKGRDIFVFNTAVLSTDIYAPSEFSELTNNIKNEVKSYTLQDYINGNYRNNALETFYYSPFKASSGINELTEININIYPNPSNGMININTNETIENINITDVNGKLVRHQTDNSPIDLSQNSKGIYFVNITTEKGVINKKIVLN